MKLWRPYEIEELDETGWKRWMWGEEAGIFVKNGVVEQDVGMCIEICGKRPRLGGSRDILLTKSLGNMNARNLHSFTFHGNLEE
jgi:hypothetical protein